MLQCLRPSQAAATDNIHSSPLPSQDDSSNTTPQSGSQPSPTVNLTNEYTLAVQTPSYGEIRVFLDIQTEPPNDTTPDQLLSEILRPNRNLVDETLNRAQPGPVTRLLWSCFDHNEHMAHMCLDLNQAIRRVRTLTAPLHDLLTILPLDSTDHLSSPQCNRAFDLLLKYEKLENPFPNPTSRTVHGTRHCFSDLNKQLKTRIKKSHSRIRFLHRTTTGAAMCLIGAALGVVVTGVVIASHALITLSAATFFPACFPAKVEKEERLFLAQLDAAQRGTYVLHQHIITIERLVDRLYSEIEGNKRFIRNGLWRGKDMHSILEVTRQLQRNNIYFEKQLTDLEEHLCLSFAAINKARSRLIQAINLHQNDRLLQN